VPVPPRVLLCATGFPRSLDDPHKPFLLDHARALAAAGVGVTVVCPGAAGLAGREVLDGIEVVRFRYGPRSLETLAYDGAMYRRVAGPHAVMVPTFLAGFVATAATVARRRQVDVVHGHWWAPTGLVALAVAAAASARSVVHLHGSDAAMAVGPLRPLAGAVLARADAVMAVSGELAAWGSEVSGRHVDVVPMPLPVARLGEPTAPPTFGPLLGVGRLVPEKGFDLLVRAAALTDQAAVVVGDGPERAALEALAASLRADVTFTGEVAPEELAARYRQARVVVVPSRREGFGMVAAEAAACGRAVVGTRVGGIPEVVADGVSGVVVAPDDLDALVAGLRTVDTAMGRAGPAQVRHLLPGPHAEAVLARYRSLLDGSSMADGSSGAASSAGAAASRAASSSISDPGDTTENASA
jgi:glycosyltransferase involved in cell wall biosynthesis